MVDLTKMFETTKHLLDAGEVVGDHRPYLGMSGLGAECSREVWYNFRWATDDVFPQRIRRLFARGHREEPEVIKELKRIGYVIISTQEAYIDETGHIKGHSDGVIANVVEAPGTPHLLEIKTMSDKYFKELVKSQSVEKTKPTYFAQTQLYMKHGKLKRALFIAVNKNDDSYYIERIRYDAGKAEDLMRKGHMILLSETPPAREFPSRTFFKCKWCKSKDMCWDKKPMNKSCRSCRNVCIENGGEWSCAIDALIPIITLEEQRVGCTKYTPIEVDD